MDPGLRAALALCVVLPSGAGSLLADVEVNGCILWKSWDPATHAGQVGMSADLRAADVAPDASGAITVGVSAAGMEEAILQGILIE